MMRSAARLGHRSFYANRRGGPEGVIDLLEARPPDGFADVEAVAPFAEREQAVRGYASLVGFAADSESKRSRSNNRTREP